MHFLNLVCSYVTSMTLFRPKWSYKSRVTDNIMHNIPHIQPEYEYCTCNQSEISCARQMVIQVPSIMLTFEIRMVMQFETYSDLF